MNKYFDEDEVKKTIALMKPDGQLFECRMLEGSWTYSGYFTDADTLVNALRREDLRNRNVYITLNEIDMGCYGRVQHDRFINIKRKEPTTGDKDIVGYNWMMIDLDPERPSGTSSSDAEMSEAMQLGNRMFLALRNLGFERPLFAYSGNGVHLLYKIQLANTPDRVALVEKCLKVLDYLFSTERVKVDVKNSNPSRICKLYGCYSVKGADTKERPHRKSYIVGNPEEIKVTDIAYLEKLAKIIPEETEKPQQYNSYNPSSFDIEKWMQKYGIGYKAVSLSGGGTKYILDHCPFDDNHKGKDAVVFRRANGALAFHCFHNSCAGKTFKDFRMRYEPNAYEKKWQEDEQRMYGRFNRDKKPVPKIEAKDNNPVFLTAQMILNRKHPDEEFIKSGITEIDRRMRGLKKGHVSVWSGLRASGKSSVLSQIGLNAANTGNNVGIYSGELTESNFLKWMMLQAAGKGYVKPSQYEGFYYTPEQTAKTIAAWLGERFWLYNNAYGNNFTAVMNEFEKKIDENKLDLLILDNLMAFNISDLGSSKWDAQTQFVWRLSQTAKDRNLHICFVAHPRKSQGFLRFDDISGTADLGNAVDDAFIVHRNNNDFRRLSQQMFGWHDDNEVYEGTNVIEIVKDRDGGAQDVFIPLYYEVESKRLKNYMAENVIYGWNVQELPELKDFEVMEDGTETPFE